MSQEFRLSPLAKECQTCPLCRHREVENQVPTEYCSPVDVMFVAEAPGASENQKGRPFIGRTGRVLRRTVQQICGSEASIAYGNIVRCRPTKETQEGAVLDRAPTTKEIKCCQPNIWRDIQKLQPKVLVILGDSAAKGLVSNRDGSPLDTSTRVGTMRGKDFVVRLPDGSSVPAVVTYHFSHVFRTPGIASVFREDIAKAVRRVRGQLSDYSQRGLPVRVIDTVPKVKKFLTHMIRNLTKDDIVAFDYETRSLLRFDNDVLCVGFAYRADQAYCIPLVHPESPFGGAEIKQVMGLLRRFFRVRNPSFRALVPHNLKFEALATLDQFGTHILMPTADTFQRAHALNEDRKGAVQFPYGLKTLVEDHLGFYHYEDADIARVIRLKDEGRIAEAPLHELAEYNGIDCYCGYRLFRWQDEWAAAEEYTEDFDRVSYSLHGNVACFLAEMERNGLLADLQRVRELMSDDSEIQARMRDILKELHTLASVKQTNRQLLAERKMGQGLHAGRESLWVFKLGEVKSKRMLFFDVLGLDPVKRSRKTGAPSIGKELFEKYKGYPEIDLYQEYGQLQKIMSTYVKSIHTFLHNDPDMRDGRVRPHFQPTGTVTGRLSSANPNMLNIPSRSKTEAAKAIKRLYIVPEGYCLVCADYSQAEVRWLAEATKDPFLVKAFVDSFEAKQICRLDPTAENRRKSKLEGDFHRHTASKINSVEISKVTDEERSLSKAVVFGLVYGMSIMGLASRLKVTRQKAEEFIEEFFAQFPVAKEWLDHQEDFGFANGYVLSPTGRRKLINSAALVGDEDYENFPKYLDHIRNHINHEMRVCRNAPIQGVASDMTLLACSRLLDHILEQRLDWKIINTVYDSIMIEVPFPEVRRCIETTQSIMEDPWLFAPFDITPQVPFAADFSIGINWGDQFDISYDSESWMVRCGECQTVRTEKTRPTNQRCEECGSRRVRRQITEGPMDQLLRQLDRDHRLSAFWT